VCAQEQIKSAAGVDARWQRLFDEHGDDIITNARWFSEQEQPACLFVREIVTMNSLAGVR
jgi:hypothetical protein